MANWTAVAMLFSLFIHSVGAITCSVGVPHRDKDEAERCCLPQTCGPGFESRICESDNGYAICDPCEDGYYKEGAYSTAGDMHKYSNMVCQKQKSCDGSKGEIVDHEGTSSTPTTCRCKAEYANVAGTCVRCEPGKIVNAAGTVCEWCEDEKYLSELGRCQNCTVCLSSEFALQNCTHVSDTVCGIAAYTEPNTSGKTAGIAIPIVIAVVLVLIILVLIVMWIIHWRRHNRQQSSRDLENQSRTNSWCPFCKCRNHSSNRQHSGGGGAEQSPLMLQDHQPDALGPPDGEHNNQLPAPGFQPHAPELTDGQHDSEVLLVPPGDQPEAPRPPDGEPPDDQQENEVPAAPAGDQPDAPGPHDGEHNNQLPAPGFQPRAPELTDGQHDNEVLLVPPGDQPEAPRPRDGEPPDDQQANEVPAAPAGDQPDAPGPPGGQHDSHAPRQDAGDNKSATLRKQLPEARRSFFADNLSEKFSAQLNNFAGDFMSKVELNEIFLSYMMKNGTLPFQDKEEISEMAKKGAKKRNEAASRVLKIVRSKGDPAFELLFDSLANSGQGDLAKSLDEQLYEKYLQGRVPEITEHRAELVQKMQLNEIFLSAMMKNETLNKRKKDRLSQLKKNNNREDAVGEFLDEVQSKGHDAFCQMVEALWNSDGEQHLAKKLHPGLCEELQRKKDDLDKNDEGLEVTSQQKRALQNCAMDILKHLDSSPFFLAYMGANSAMSQQQITEIQIEQIHDKRNGKFIDQLWKCGRKGFEQFLSALENTGQKELLAELRKVLDSDTTQHVDGVDPGGDHVNDG